MRKSGSYYMFLKVVLLVVFKSAFITYSQTLIFHDPLDNHETVGEIVITHQGIGEGFTHEGWRAGHNNSGIKNHILYRFQNQSEEGMFEFEVKGMSNLGGGNGDEDCDPAFCGFYDGRGIKEPCDYFQGYKNNYFRWNVHWRGDKKKIKCVINCADSKSERINSNKAVFTDGLRDWVSEPNGLNINWKPDYWYHFKIIWKNKQFEVYINNEFCWSAEWGRKPIFDYKPQDFRIWLGCAPCFG